jgi:hypothetical protein
MNICLKMISKESDDVNARFTASAKVAEIPGRIVASAFDQICQGQNVGFSFPVLECGLAPTRELFGSNDLYSLK